MSKEKKEMKKKENKKVEEDVITPDNDNTAELEKKRDNLIKELQSKLLTKTQLKQGGRNIRNRASMESGYQANLDEINELGKQIGIREIGFGDIRRK
jgi:hypothetical protein